MVDKGEQFRYDSPKFGKSKRLSWLRYILLVLIVEGKEKGRMREGKKGGNSEGIHFHRRVRSIVLLARLTSMTLPPRHKPTYYTVTTIRSPIWQPQRTVSSCAMTMCTITKA